MHARSFVIFNRNHYTSHQERERETLMTGAKVYTHCTVHNTQKHTLILHKRNAQNEKTLKQTFSMESDIHKCDAHKNVSETQNVCV